jgi:acyl-coenzyme A synthetase/AMP-(fatty) acid ligase
MPSHVAFLDVMPYNDTGKLLRRVLKSSLAEEYGS